MAEVTGAVMITTTGGATETGMTTAMDRETGTGTTAGMVPATPNRADPADREAVTTTLTGIVGREAMTPVPMDQEPTAPATVTAPAVTTTAMPVPVATLPATARAPGKPRAICFPLVPRADRLSARMSEGVFVDGVR